MKKTYTVFIYFICFVFLFIGCNQANNSDDRLSPPKSQNDSSTSSTISVEDPTKSSFEFKSDDYYLSNYIYGLDIVFPELAFTDATKIKSEDLFMFFKYIVDYEKLFNYWDWFEKKEHKFHVPAAIIEPILKKYLNINSFDVRSIEGYDKEKNEIITSEFGQYGGDRIARIDKKEYLGNDTVRLTVEFNYDLTDDNLKYINIYEIQIDPKDDKNYKYLSINHVKEQS